MGVNQNIVATATKVLTRKSLRQQTRYEHKAARLISTMLPVRQNRNEERLCSIKMSVSGN